MSPWDHLSPEELIKAANAGNYGLAKQKWTEQLAQIRALPEPPPADEEAAG
jgi:hypothetical protein